MDETKEQLKNILKKNSDIPERIAKENWDIKYRKGSDMIIMGTDFPKGSLYFYVNGSGVMVRIDKDEKIYGFAIENAKYFIKNNQEICWLFYPLIYPVRFFWMKCFYRSTNKIKRIMVVSNYVASEACYI